MTVKLLCILLLESKYRVVYLSGATILRCSFQKNLNQIPLKQSLNTQASKGLFKLLASDGATALVDEAKQLKPSAWTYANHLSLSRMISFPINCKDMYLMNGSLGG